VSYCVGGVIDRAIDKGIQDGLKADIDHGKAGRGLAKVAAYNLLASHKDASMSDLMDLLCLEGPTAETLKAIQLQPSLEQLMLPIHRSKDQNLIGEASTSRVPTMATTTALSTTFIQTSFVPSVFVADYEVSDVGPSTKVPSSPAIVFENETLETTPKHGVSD
nr:hypothetical protein [Tanacetum cinerariifolium]